MTKRAETEGAVMDKGDAAGTKEDFTNEEKIGWYEWCAGEFVHPEILRGIARYECGCLRAWTLEDCAEEVLVPERLAEIATHFSAKPIEVKSNECSQHDCHVNRPGPRSREEALTEIAKILMSDEAVQDLANRFGAIRAQINFVHQPIDYSPIKIDEQSSQFIA